MPNSLASLYLIGYEDKQPIDLEDWHIYRIDWTADGEKFYLDDRLLHQTAQSPNYEIQLMLTFYQLPHDTYNKWSKDAFFEIDYVKGYKIV